jgi:4-amino-4-deoxy-L-arabinose transferase-like glycosyltransferase
MWQQGQRPEAPATIERAWAGGPGASLVAAILLLALVRVLVAAATGLTEDEAYYRLWSLAPAWGYLDHAPMVAWMIAAGRWIAGDNPLGVRLGGIVASVAGPFILWRTASLLFGAAIARKAVWIALAMPLLAVGGVIVTPDTPSVLFWGLAAWALTELHCSRNANWWLAVGAFAGLGLLSKYSNLFFGAGILLWLLLIPANRAWFRSWQLWAGGAIAAAIALPMVLWNAQNEWVSFAKQFGRVGAGQKLTVAYLAELFGAYVGLASPIIAVLGLIGLGHVLRSAWRTRDQSSALLASGIAPLLAYFLAHALHDRVQPNWVAPIYASLAVCAALALARIEPAGGAVFGWLGRSALALGFAMSALLYLHAVFPLVLSPGLKDPSAQTRGWGAMAKEVERLRTANGACWIATSSYATTGQLAYALKDKAPVVQLTERLRYEHLPPLDTAALLECPAIHVELKRRSALPMLEVRFRTVMLLETVVRSERGTELARYPVYLIANPIADKVFSRDAGTR